MLGKWRASADPLLARCVKVSSFVVAYLMWKNNTDFENAKCLVRKVRNVTRPNMGFQCQLMQWHHLQNQANGKMQSRLML